MKGNLQLFTVILAKCPHKRFVRRERGKRKGYHIITSFWIWLVQKAFSCKVLLLLLFPLQIKIIIKCRGHNGPLFILQWDGIWAGIKGPSSWDLCKIKSKKGGFNKFTSSLACPLRKSRYTMSYVHGISDSDDFYIFSATNS